MSNTAAKYIVIVSRLKSTSKIKSTAKQIVNIILSDIFSALLAVVETSKRVFYIVENKIKNI